MFLEPVPVADHAAVISHWDRVERWSSSLAIGGSVDAIIAAARELHARELIRALREADAKLRVDGDRLYIGPARAISEEQSKMVKIVKKTIVDILKPMEVDDETTF